MNLLLEWIEKINSAINNVVWGIPMLILIIGTGIIMTFGTKFFQITKAKHVTKETIGGVFSKKEVRKTKEKASISQFQALCTALAATIGTGNIAGVATAIAIGGPGAVFWMWFSAFFGMMTNFSENILGIYYRRKNYNDEWCGGAMYYLRDGLGAKKHCKTLGKVLAVLFSIFCILASFGIGNMTQINTISNAVNTTFGISPYITGIILMIIAALVIIGGIKRIASVTEKFVPVMAILYVIGTVYILIANIHQFDDVFVAIFKGAFGFNAVAGGGIGILIKTAVTMGFKRGVFSNEAGLGSSVMVHSASNVKEPVTQGMWGIFEVFFDTMIICTLTAFSILSSGVVNLQTGEMLNNLQGVELVVNAFSTTIGSFAGIFITVAILFFAFSTVLGWSYYGTKAFEFLFGTKATIIYKVIFVVFIIFGSVSNLQLAWDISDTFNGLMAIPNLIGVLALSGTVFKITKNYLNRKIKNSDEEPMLSAFDDIQKMQIENK